MPRRHNLLAVGTCVVLQGLIGYLFYGTMPFHQIWMNAWGLDAAKMVGDPFQPYFLSMLASVVSCFSMSWLVQKVGVTEWVGGAGLGVVLWTGFSASLLMVHYRFAQVAPVALYIDISKDLFCIVPSCIILTTWQAG